MERINNQQSSFDTRLRRLARIAVSITRERFSTESAVEVPRDQTVAPADMIIYPGGEIESSRARAREALAEIEEIHERAASPA